MGTEHHWKRLGVHHLKVLQWGSMHLLWFRQYFLDYESLLTSPKMTMSRSSVSAWMTLAQIGSSWSNRALTETLRVAISSLVNLGSVSRTTNEWLPQKPSTYLLHILRGGLWSHIWVFVPLERGTIIVKAVLSHWDSNLLPHSPLFSHAAKPTSRKFHSATPSLQPSNITDRLGLENHLRLPVSKTTSFAPWIAWKFH